ncbi:MAG: flagellar hook-length control protein FliK [Magnetospirillum sp. WYHS-4]
MYTENQYGLRALGVTESSAIGQTVGDGKATGGSGAAFLEILSQAQADAENGANLMTASASVGRLPGKTEIRAERPAQQAERNEPARPAKDKTVRAADRSDKPEAPRAEPREELVEQAAERPDQAADGQADDPVARTDSADAGRQARDDRRDRTADDSPAVEHAVQADGQIPADQQNRQAQVDAVAERQAVVDAGPAVVTGAVARQGQDTVLAALAAAQQAQARQQNQSAGPATPAATVEDGDVSVDPQAGRPGHLGEQWQAAAKAAGDAQDAANGQQSQLHNQANAALQAQARAAEAHAAKGADKAAQQAAQLSQAIGAGDDVQVQVQVEDEAAVLFSKPASGMGGALLNPEPSEQARLPGQQTPQVLGNPNPQLLAQQAASGPVQPQQAAAQAANQVLAAGGVEGKGAAQGTAQAGMPAPNMPASGESAPLPGQANQTQQSQQTAQTQAVRQPRFTLPGQGVADQVSVQITKALQDGNDRISISLKPASLGRIEVSMELAQDGRLTAVVTADNKDTLDLLQRDARNLQQALEDAGLHLDSGSLSFNLREQNQRQAEGEGNLRNPYGTGARDEEPDVPAPPTIALGQGGMTADGRVDIRA